MNNIDQIIYTISAHLILINSQFPCSSLGSGHLVSSFGEEEPSATAQCPRPAAQPLHPMTLVIINSQK